MRSVCSGNNDSISEKSSGPVVNLFQQAKMLSKVP
jgi:hypothetical protein